MCVVIFAFVSTRMSFMKLQHNTTHQGLLVMVVVVLLSPEHTHTHTHTHTHMLVH